jgi:hypothetical protein
MENPTIKEILSKYAKESGTYRAELHILHGYYDMLFDANPYTSDFAKEQFKKILSKYEDLFDGEGIIKQ